ncbi:androgen-induced gene 1 protein-like isoform X2 [Wyeomyia smithii]|uniref:androgen-induced gene 1 protein-like isoform X2 n=1 Tax=Wyeomyia smithii TaxID=174621 RepID=UPI00246807E3|nr:androgen-induced gene 1 protein-like isoform X2 [Wyeomyia smithii]
MSLPILATFHGLTAIHYFYSMYYDLYVIGEYPKEVKELFGGTPVNDEYQLPLKGREVFLTYWNLILQAIYFTVCLVNDFFGTNEVSPRSIPIIRKLKDYMLAAFAFPVALNVGVTFWTLMAIDRELVFPKALDAVFPGWLNHVMHTNIVIFMLLEICTSFRQYPSRKNGLAGLGFFMACYLVWLHIIRHFGGIWVYPVLEVLNLPQRIIFFVVSLGFSVGLYLLGEFFNSLIWTKELKQLKTGVTSKKLK